MTTTMDAGGRVVIPKEVRDEMGLRPGARIDVVVRDGMVVLMPQIAAVRLVERDGRLVAVPEGDMPALTVDAVREALEASRR